jgi:HAD superfamily hydrolase (TIGR01509 family)
MIEGILFDSGGVLMGPRGGRWWPIYGFEQAVLAHAPDTSFDALDTALLPAMAYMDQTHPNEDWREFYRIVVLGLGVAPTQAMLDDIAAIKPSDAVDLFPDVLPCLRRLQARGLAMAVVSDAWPNLPDIHTALGIQHFFSGYAISSVVGCSKPDPRMYAAGARALNRAASTLLFVDDSDDLVQAAIDLGYHGVALCRSGTPPAAPVPWITSLDALDQYLS